ncbi:MAG: rhodanese-like domain-containing protein [Oscillospiraceae bacterium]|nr:rhodanese-like domain-containing protein [Oscillospiraceae bacterium]
MIIRGFARHFRFKSRVTAIVFIAVFLFTSCANGEVRTEDTPPAGSATEHRPVLSAQTGEDKDEEYATITAEEALKIMGENPGAVILDVRTEEEFEREHIPLAVVIPVDELSARAEDELGDKEAVILVYCRSGARSARAAAMLAGMGYVDVFDFGGILDWPYETIAGGNDEN